jgi:hypothetical protein
LSHLSDEEDKLRKAFELQFRGILGKNILGKREFKAILN